MRRFAGMRGTAAVEMILSLPFLAMFVVAMYDFAVGYSARSQAARGSRHVAWHAARDADGKIAQDGALLDTQTVTAHFGKKTNNVQRAVASRDAYLDIPDVGADWFDDVVSGGFQEFGEAVSWLTEEPLTIWGVTIDFHVQIAAGLPSYLIGTVSMTDGEASAGVRPRAGLGDSWIGPRRVKSKHYVAMQTWREPEPETPEGWFDPFKRLLDFLKGVGSMIGEWLAEAAAEAAQWILG